MQYGTGLMGPLHEDASGILAGMKVVVVKTDERGNIDIGDLRAKAEAHRADLVGVHERERVARRLGAPHLQPRVA